MRYTPSLGAALAKLGLLIPICVAGDTPSMLDLSSPPKSELFWSLDGETKSYCSDHLREALDNPARPQAPRAVSKKAAVARKKSETVKPCENADEDAPIACHATAKVIEQDLKLKQAPELLCKPCHLNPKIATQPQQALQVTRSSADEESLQDSAWNELIPSSANEACDRERAFNRDEEDIPAGQAFSNSPHHFTDQPSALASESNLETEKKSKSGIFSNVSDDDSLPPKEAANRLASSCSIPQFVVEAGYAQANDSERSYEDFPPLPLIHPEMVDSLDLNADAPQPLSERSDLSTSACMHAASCPSTASPIASSAEIGPQVDYERQVPPMAEQGSQQQADAQPQASGNADSPPASMSEELPQPDLATAWMPALLAQDCQKCVAGMPQDQQIPLSASCAKNNDELVSSATDESLVPTSLTNSCREQSAAQQTSTQNFSESICASGSTVILPLPTEAYVPEPLGKANDGSVGVPAQASTGAGHDQERGANRLSAQDSPTSDLAGGNKEADGIDISHAYLPSTNLSAAHPEIPHLAALLTARFSPSTEEKTTDTPEVCTALSAKAEEPQLEAQPPAETLVVELEAAPTADAEMQAVYLRLEDLLADIRVMQDKQQAKIERETALELGYSSQLLTFPLSLVATIEQAPENLTNQPLAAESGKIGATASPSDVAILSPKEELAVSQPQIPSAIGGRRAKDSAPAPASYLTDKVAGLSSDEAGWEERVKNLPPRCGVFSAQPRTPNNKLNIRARFVATVLHKEPHVPPAIGAPPQVNFRPAGFTAISEDESFCQTGVKRATPTPPPPRNQNKLGSRTARTEKQQASSQTNSSFQAQVKPKTAPVQQQRKNSSAGTRASQSSLSALRTVVDLFISQAHASQVYDPTVAFESVGVGSLSDQDTAITAAGDETWWNESVAEALALPEEDNHLVIGVRDHARPAEEIIEAPTPAGIENLGHKPFSLGVSRQGQLWSPQARPTVEEALLEIHDRPEPFSSITLAPVSLGYTHQETDEDIAAEPPLSFIKNNYDWALDELESESEDYFLSYDEDWQDWEPEEEPEEELDEETETEVQVEDDVLEQDEELEANVESPDAHIALNTTDVESATAQLDPFTPSRDLNPDRILAQESVSIKLTDHPQTTPTPPPPPPATKGFTMNFPNVSIREFVRFVSRETEKNFIYNEEELDFNVTIVSAEPTSLENIMAALLQELRIHGFSLIEQGNTLIIHRSGANSPAKMWADETHIDEADIVTRVFRLKNVPLNEMAPVVKQMLSDKALVQMLQESQSLIVTDLAENIQRLSSLINSLDLPAKTFELGQYVAINNFVENLIPLAEQILRPLAGNETLTFVPHLATNSVFIVAAPALVKRTISVMEHLDHLEGQTQILTLDKLIPGGLGTSKSGSSQEQTDGSGHKPSASVRRRPFDLSPENLLRSEAGHLDIESEVNPNDNIPSPFRNGQGYGSGDTPQKRPVEKTPDQITAEELENTKFYIYRLQYRKGDQLVDALSRIAESLRYNEKANIDLINAITSVQWIESSNSIMVTGTKLALDKVKQLIDEIDVPLRQILLEMLLIETDVADGLNFSVDWASDFADPHAAAAQAWQSEAAGSGLLKLPSQTAIAGQLAVPTLGQQGFQLGVIGRRILLGDMYFSSLGLLVNALHTTTDVNIKLNPKIVVEDNTPAELFVGQNTAFLSQAITNQLGNVIANNVEFRDVGTRLSVTPLIGNGDMITLVIALEDSKNISGSTTGGSIGSSNNSINPGPTTATTRTTTKIHVPNKFFVILSGMIREEKTVLQSQLPCLGGIPVLAGFAKSKQNTVTKRNLMIFIRPQIIETEWEYDEITRREQNIYRMNSQDKKPSWQYEIDEALEFLHLPRFNERERGVPSVNADSSGDSSFWD